MAARSLNSDDDTEKASPYFEQREFMGRSKRFYGFISGTGAGKTFAGVYRLWMNAKYWNPNAMGAIIVPDKSQFVDNVKPIMEKFGLMDKWEYKSVYTDEPGLHTHNDQRILILSADNQRQIGRIKGKNLGYVWMDEEAEIDPRAREIAQQRLRVGSYPNLFITTTPEGHNHTWEFFDGEHNPEIRECGEGMIYECDNRLAVVGVPPEANPAIRDEDIASMRESLPDEIVQQEIEGLFVEVGGGVFQRDMWNWVEPEYVAEATVQPVMGIDPAATADATKARESDSDYWAVTVAYKHSRKNSLYVADTSQRRGMTLSEGVEWLHSIVQQIDQQPEIVVEANQSQRWLQQKLGERGIPAAPVQTTRDKEDKLIDLSIPVSDGTVQFIDWSGDQDDFTELRNQMLSFPDASHDDLMDSLALVVNHSNLGGTSIFGGSYGGDDDEW